MTQWRRRRQKENARKTKAEGKQKPPPRGRRGVKKGAEYDELINLLCCGHELEFNYDGRTYYLEFAGNNTYEFYDITSKRNSILLERMQGKTMEDLIALFMRTPILSGRSFNEVYSSIPFVNVD